MEALRAEEREAKPKQEAHGYAIVMKRWWGNDRARLGGLYDGLAQLNRQSRDDDSSDFERYYRVLECFAASALAASSPAEPGGINRRRGPAGSDQSAVRRPATGDRHLHAIRTFVEEVAELPFDIGLFARERDGDAGSEDARSALAALRSVVLRTLDEPQFRLAVYGSLRRGQPNHGWLVGLGEPVSGEVTGSIEHIDGYPVLRWRDAGDVVGVEVYSSSLLDARRWAALDDFEGSGYRRVFVPVCTADGATTVATLYADARP